MYEDEIFSEIEQSEKSSKRKQNINANQRSGKSAKKVVPNNKTSNAQRKKSPEKPPLENRNRKAVQKTAVKKQSAYDKKTAYGDGYSDKAEKERAKAEKERIKKEREKIRKTAEKKAEKSSAPSPKRRRTLRIVSYSLIFAAVLAVGVVLSLTVLFKSEEITVDGNVRYATEDIAQASGLALGENIFLADKKTPAQTIVEEFPYIEKADVGFRIPNVLTISVTEATPAYAIKLNEEYFIISSKGRILEKTTSAPQGIPLLAGTEMTNTKEGEYVKFNDALSLSILQDVIDCLEENNFENLTSVDITNVAKIKLVYDNRINIILGVPEDIDYKIRTAMKIIDEHLDPDKNGRIQGNLDVSSCNTTKKSYFNEDVVAATQPLTTEPVTEPPTEDSGDSYDDSSNDDSYYDDSYSDDSYSDDSYSDDSYSDDSYSDDSYSDDSYSDDSYSDDSYSDDSYSDDSYSEDSYSDDSYSDDSYE